MVWSLFKKGTNIAEYTDKDKANDKHLGLVFNLITTLRRKFSGLGHGISPDGKRNYNVLFGYGEDLSFNDYFSMYRRGGIAHTVVEKIPKACWRDLPILKEGENEVLAKELKELKRRGYFKALEKADILNRIGNYSILVVGIPDGREADQPVGQIGKIGFKDIYFNAYDYDSTDIIEYEKEPSSLRYGLPVMYSIRTSARNASTSKVVFTKSFNVHWSRVVHLAEGALSNSLEGCSSLEAPWNSLIDKDKVRGSAAESYYRNSRQKLALEADKDAQLSQDTAALAELKENVENFQNGYEDVLRLDKMTANMLQPGIATPRDAFDIAIEDISGTTEIPVRLLTTRTAGNLTGTEDKASWNGLIMDRQEQDCTLWLLSGLGIMENAGILALPEDLEVFWPPRSALTVKEESEVIEKKAIAINLILLGLSKSAAIEPESAFSEVGLNEVIVTGTNLGEEDDRESTD